MHLFKTPTFFDTLLSMIHTHQFDVHVLITRICVPFNFQSKYPVPINAKLTTHLFTYYYILIIIFDVVFIGRPLNETKKSIFNYRDKNANWKCIQRL